MFKDIEDRITRRFRPRSRFDALRDLEESIIRRFRPQPRVSSRTIWMAAVGTTVGVAAGLLLSQRGKALLRRVRPDRAVDPSLVDLEEGVVEALRQDPLVGERPIDVAALAPGIIELTGAVDDQDEARRAVEISQRVPGVRTVLNRLDAEEVEAALEGNRRRAEATEPGRTGQWHGVGVGMGTRRQGAETDPARPDDSQKMIERELGADRAVEQTSDDFAKPAAGVEGHTVMPGAPTDRGAATEASDRRLGNVNAGPPQDRNPNAGPFEEVQPGTELTLEKTGLEGELIRRDLENKS